MKSILLFMGIGMEEMLVIGLVVLVFFGANKVPEFMKGLGKGVREFKNGLNKIQDEVEESVKETPARKELPKVDQQAEQNPD
ncbi:MAG TPA: twin-arginine translocase TatA/TatE family subunit [Chryseosolibacter sp.]